MKDNSDLMLLDEKSIKIKDLEDALNKVEMTYAYWLSMRENLHTGEKPDRLDNYYRYISMDKGIQFYVKDGLPQEIKNACWSAYKNIFG